MYGRRMLEFGEITAILCAREWVCLVGIIRICSSYYDYYYDSFGFTISRSYITCVM